MKKPEGSLKMKSIFVIFLLVLIVLGVLYGYSLQKRNTTLKEEVTSSRSMVEQHERILRSINDESLRCKELISEGTAEFGDFAFCERFLEWSNRLEL